MSISSRRFTSETVSGDSIEVLKSRRRKRKLKVKKVSIGWAENGWTNRQIYGRLYDKLLKQNSSCQLMINIFLITNINLSYFIMKIDDTFHTSKLHSAPSNYNILIYTSVEIILLVHSVICAYILWEKYFSIIFAEKILNESFYPFHLCFSVMVCIATFYFLNHRPQICR